MENNLEAQTELYKDGQIIFAEYECGDNFYLIQSGRVELIKMFGEVIKTLDVLQPSEMFGEMALLEDSPRSATAIALGETKLMCFDRHNFQNLVLTNPNIAFKLLKMFVRRIYDARRRFMVLTLAEPNTRVADVFLMLNEGRAAMSDREISGRREFQVNIESIARWSGLSNQQAKDSIMYYTRLGYMETHSDRMIVKDINNFIRIVNNARSKQLVNKT